MKLNKYIVVLVLFGSAICSSCSDFLDKEISYDYTNEGFYKSDNAVQYGLTGAYESLYFSSFQTNNETLPFYILHDHFTGMGVERTENSTLGAGVVTPSNGMTTGAWKMSYVTIARCNAIIDGSIPYLNDLSALGLSGIAEAKVLKAWAYYHLAYYFGDVVIYKTTPTTAEYQKAKSTQQEVVDYAIELINEALPMLEYNKTSTKNLGRIDKSVALGIKARLALNAGSLNAGGVGNTYFEIARDAAKEIMDNAARELNPDFEALFQNQGQVVNANNELMLQLMYSDQGSRRTHYVGLAHASRMYGQSGRFPTQMFVDQFECNDGKRIDESPIYDPSQPFANRDNRLQWSIWSHGDTVIGNSGNKVKFVFDVYRDSIQSFAASKWQLTLNRDVKGGVAPYSPVKSGLGYIWKKYLNHDEENVFRQSTNIVLMRYSEILLTYAEAKIELNELDQSVYDAINKVRQRADQPNVDASRIGNVDKMIQIVRRERKVELMLEGLHLFDMRRWKTGELENSQPSYGYPNAILDPSGMNILSHAYENASADMVPNFKKSTLHDINDMPDYSAYANTVIAQDDKGNDILNLKSRDRNRSWNDRFYRWPVPHTELEKNTLLVQNPDYK